jgi:hypothetical protein
MILTQNPTTLPATDKLFSYQVSSGIVNTVYNYMYDGNFQHLGSNYLNANSSNFWQTQSGTGLYTYSRTIVADQTLGNAAVFNGYNSYIKAFFGSYNFNNVNGLNGVRVYRSTWNTTNMECIAYGQTWYLMINQTPGYLSYFQMNSSSLLLEVKIPLSSLSVGWHTMVFGSDSGHVYLNVDNGAYSAQITSATTGNGVLPNQASASYLGCFAQNTGIGDQQMYFFTGYIKDFATWSQLNQLTPSPSVTYIANLYAQGEVFSQQTNIGITYALYAGLVFHVTFDNDSTSYDVDLIQGQLCTNTNVTFTTTTGGWYVGRSLYVPINNPGATAVGFKGVLTSPTLANSSQFYLGMSINGQGLGGVGIVTIILTDGTHSWSTNLSIAQLNTNTWQQFSWGFNPATYGLTTNVYMSVQITGNCTGNIYFDHIILSPSIASPYFDLGYQDSSIRNVSYSSVYGYMGTQYTYAYIKNWTDVGSLPTLPLEVGTLGSTITLQLNRDPNNSGEGYDLKLNNRVYIQYASPNSPTGSAYFDGYIADYTLDYNNNYVSVIIASWGQQAINYMLLTGSASILTNNFTDSALVPTPIGSSWNVVAGLILAVTIPAGQTIMSGLAIGGIAPTGAAITGVSTFAVFSTFATAVSSSTGAGSINISSALAYGISPTTFNPGFAPLTINFNQNLNVVPGQTYYIAMTFPNLAAMAFWTSNAALSTTSALYIASSSNTSNVAPTSAITALALNFQLLGANNSSTPLYTKQDPSAILKSVVNNLRLQGANLNYSSTSIDTVGAPVTYQFQSSTGSDAFTTIVTLCPPGWMLYVDQATNLVHLHAYSTRTIHKLLLGFHIQQLTFEKRMDTMINTIYFTGGIDPTTGANIYRYYQNAGSVALYGVRMKQITDNRVTTAATADIVAQSYLNVNPEIRTTITIADKAYPIDSLVIGDIVNFGNFQNGKTTNWDQVVYGISSAVRPPEGYWDFDITSPETLYLYIERVENDVDSSQLTLSTTPPEISKKVQAALNSLLKTQTLANPPSPTNGTNLIT